MARPDSVDLPERVMAAVEHGGMSRHQMAVYFAASVSCAIKWVERVRRTASAARGQMARVAVLAHPKAKVLLSTERFSIAGKLLEGTSGRFTFAPEL
jgi:transposase